MRLRIALVLLIVETMLCSGFVIIAVAQDHVDQQQTDFSDLGVAPVGDGYWYGQSFKPTLNILTRVELYLDKTDCGDADIIVSIRSELNGDDLTSISKTSDQIPDDGSWVEFDFPDIQVTPEDTYYVVVGAPDLYGGEYCIWGSESDPYNRGCLWEMVESDGEWSDTENIDAAFKTYGYNSEHIVELIPDSYDFGDVEIDTYSQIVEFTLTNTGTETATGTVYITGNDADQFEITQGGGVFSLDLGESKTIKIRFHPTEAGVKNAELIADGSNCDDDISSLSGNGVYMNHAPYTPSDPIPENGATDITLDIDGKLPHSLSFYSGDPDENDFITYTLYFGTDSDPPFYDVFYSPPATGEIEKMTYYKDLYLEDHTTYYWRIKAEDNTGATTEGETWCFTTGIKMQDVTLSKPDKADEWIDPLSIYSLPNLVRWSNTDEKTWLKNNGYGSKIKCEGGYARAATKFIPFDVVHDWYGTGWLTVSSFIGCRYTVPIVYGKSSWHKARVSIKGYYEGYIKAFTLANTHISVDLIITDPEVYPHPYFYSQSKEYVTLEEKHYTAVSSDYDNPHISGYLTHEDDYLEAWLQEGHTYDIWVGINAQILVAGFAISDPIPNIIAGGALSDIKFWFDEIKIDYHNPPPSPPENEHPPDTPLVPSGSQLLKTGETAEYSTTSDDLDGDKIYYKWYWGDGTTSEWVEESSQQHSYDLPGVYYVRVQAKDDSEYELESNLSEGLQVNVTPPDGTITIETPTAGEEWRQGTKHKIKWNSIGDIGDKVGVALYKNDGSLDQYITSEWVQNTGEYLYKIDPYQKPGEYSIVIMSLANAGCSRCFTVVENNPPTLPEISYKKVGAMRYRYSAVSTDPEGDLIKYVFEIDKFGGNEEHSTAYVDSGENGYLYLNYKGKVKVKAVDACGKSSEWSKWVTPGNARFYERFSILEILFKKMMIGNAWILLIKKIIS